MKFYNGHWEMQMEKSFYGRRKKRPRMGYGAA